MRGEPNSPHQLSRNTAALSFYHAAPRTIIMAQLPIFPKAVRTKNGVLPGIGKRPFANDAFADEQQSFPKVIHTAS